VHPARLGEKIHQQAGLLAERFEVSGFEDVEGRFHDA
jgi:hypothetical protein